MDVSIEDGLDVHTKLLEFEVPVYSTGFFSLVQPDADCRGMPDYSELVYVVYGPFGNEDDIPAREIVRSQRLAQREVVEEIRSRSPCPPGKYYAAIWNPSGECEGGGQATFTVHLAVGGERTHNHLPAKVIEFDAILRAKLSLVTAHRSKESVHQDIDEITTYGAYTATGGYVLAARNKSHADIKTNFDFSDVHGLVLPDPDDPSNEEGLKTVQLEMEPHQVVFVGEFLPTQDSTSFNLSVDIQAPKAAYRAKHHHVRRSGTLHLTEDNDSPP